ncbi:DUF4349 domain-containing protein [Streptomyces sp. ITFR-16]|uniref:DUF4349 domain-containing protein n=1 Tax=Streptomyces sp. ITFR-16 TaxID=3075198 RepID=UPI00288B1545|nr:DUF4349 domain-containing protein [Streptomyces sp. ITFR-16]WNI21746.1 DUF4349 domain-containing protein [Streptomyces sp. ITFR-16]
MQAAPITRTGRASLAAGLLTAVVVLSGCGAGSGDDSGARSDKRAYAPADGSRADAAAGAKEGTAASAAPRKTERLTAPHVIRTASLSVEVRSVSRAAAAARTTVQAAGGLVANESTEQVDETRATSHLVLRVPQESYDQVLRDLSGAGKLLSRTSSAKDVTDQVVDVDSRIATQRASVTRVRKLMDRADKLADVVTLEGELSSRQAELESLLAQQASLKDRTSLATVTLDLMEPETVADEDDGGPGFLDALGGGWHAFVTGLRWLALAIGASAPFLAVAAVLAALWRVLRRRSRKEGPAGE